MNQWIDDWVAHWFDWLSQRASLAAVGLPVVPVNPDALPGRVRDLLPEWSQYWSDQVKAAHEKSRKAAK